MWEALAQMLVHWQISPFGTAGWVLSGLLWWRASRVNREITSWMQADTDAKISAATAQQAIREALHSMDTRIAVIESRVGR